MATKTITLEIGAYEKLRAAKRSGESFSAVVRRAVFVDEPLTGAELLETMRNRKRAVSDAYLKQVEAADRTDRPPDDPWT